jgi:hypothetical protein
VAAPFDTFDLGAGPQPNVRRLFDLLDEVCTIGLGSTQPSRITRACDMKSYASFGIRSPRLRASRWETRSSPS